MGSRIPPQIPRWAPHRPNREEKKRLRELERQAKEQAKLSAAELARLEVETFEEGLAVLLSIHKEQRAKWDWTRIAASLPPHKPRRQCRHELKAQQMIGFLSPTPAEALSSHPDIEKSRAEDEREYQEMLDTHAAEQSHHARIKDLAHRVLAGDLKAYLDALVEFGGFAEISELGSSLHFTVHDKTLIECSLRVNGSDVIPSELKTLTATGKVSIKPMPRIRFQEIYQDYVCGCALRVSRDVFALLPINHVLVNAATEILDPATGQPSERTILSVSFTRSALDKLDFEHLDPSAAVESFHYRGNFRGSKKTGEFQSIEPLSPTDFRLKSPRDLDFGSLLAVTRETRKEILAQAKFICSQPQARAL
jgi:hypothetical protein